MPTRWQRYLIAFHVHLWLACYFLLTNYACQLVYSYLNLHFNYTAIVFSSYSFSFQVMISATVQTLNFLSVRIDFLVLLCNKITCVNYVIYDTNVSWVSFFKYLYSSDTFLCLGNVLKDSEVFIPIYLRDIPTHENMICVTE